MTLTISVTADNIAHGEAGECSRCPIALAAFRDLSAGFVVVQETEIVVEGSPILADGKYAIPGEADRFIGNFDYGIPVEPFSFPIGQRIVGECHSCGGNIYAGEKFKEVPDEDDGTDLWCDQCLEAESDHHRDD